MLCAIVLLSAQVGALARQPRNIQVVGYQRVAHALADGAPDPAAPDNFYVRITTRYTLVADSDKAPADASGTRSFTTPGKKFVEYEWYDETGKAPASLAAMFTQVSRPGSESGFRKHWVSRGERQPLTQPVSRGSHLVFYEILKLTDEVETHTQGQLRVTRTKHRNYFSSTMNRVGEGQVYDPAEKGDPSEVRPKPPVYH